MASPFDQRPDHVARVALTRCLIGHAKRLLFTCRVDCIKDACKDVVESLVFDGDWSLQASGAARTMAQLTHIHFAHQYPLPLPDKVKEAFDIIQRVMVINVTAEDHHALVMLFAVLCDLLSHVAQVVP